MGPIYGAKFMGPNFMGQHLWGQILYKSPTDPKNTVIIFQ